MTETRVIKVRQDKTGQTREREISGAEAIAPLFEGLVPEHCCSQGGPGCCCGEE